MFVGWMHKPLVASSTHSMRSFFSTRTTPPQRGLEAMFQSLSNEGFRSLLNSVRRRLPMTKQKMDWGGIVIHKLNKTLGNSSTSSK